MSIVDERGMAVLLAPKARPVLPVRSERIRARNRRWLQRKRAEDLSVGELARKVCRPITTVSRGLAWAEQEEERAEELAVEAERDLVLDPVSGLSEDDVLYLLEEYSPDSELGGHPMFWKILGPLLDKIAGSASESDLLVTAEVA